MSARLLLGTAGKFKWYHWAGSIATAGAINVGLMVGMAKTYRWYYADHEESVRSFREKYGLPTERQRLEVFEWLAPTWDSTIGAYEKTGADQFRLEHLTKAWGDVLEVAVGTGRCFEALKQSGEVRSFVGVDCLEVMLQEARPKLVDLPFPARVVRGDAQSLPFPDASFDTVVASLCLCSVENSAAALSEMGRVCRPDGHVLLVEPGLARSWPARFAQRYLGLVPDPKHAWECGWYDDLDPPALVEACPGLQLASCQVRSFGNWYLMVAKPQQH
eukprot:CAMPEP_0179047882 /NCGR_PEP_ID=MMETSP0796-20121207/19425_1 /TAXON_ID=73915 /ORGANISM="Pyrodinium bahamense, Strain pbaha01" /LENGTH=273 /DNA_ID=CAMNT_0020744339 /DNA_START=55 /DNA_END=876 /DNA_ORIENTATION=+